MRKYSYLYHEWQKSLLYFSNSIFNDVLFLLVCILLVLVYVIGSVNTSCS